MILLGLSTVASVAAAAPATPPAVSVATWNTDLEPWLPNQQSVIDTIAQSSVDVLGLQSVWTDAAERAILADPRIAQKYPYSYYPAAQQQAGGCPSFVPTPVMQDFIASVLADGIDPRQLEQPSAALSATTRFQLLNLSLISQPCVGALVSTLQALPPGADPYSVIPIVQAETGPKWVHGGSPGQLILSDQPIINVSAAYFDTYLTHRANIYATVGGLRIAFADWQRNVLQDLYPNVAPLQTGDLQPEQSLNTLIAGVDVVAGTLNSEPTYQPDGFNLLTENGYRPAFTQPTYCPAATHSTYVPCQLSTNQAAAVPVSLTFDNILASNASRCWAPTTFATIPSSDHIGLSAICAKNTAPIAQNDSFVVDQDKTLTVAAPGVLSNDSDAETDPIIPTVATPPTHAAAFVLNADGSFSYTPTAGYTGPDSFTYTDSDGNLNSTVATVSITVRPLFPRTGVLDSYTRTDGAIGSNWGGLSSTSFYRVAGKQLDVQLGGPLIWKPTIFGTTQEAFLTLAKIDPNGPAQGVLLKTQTDSLPDAGAIIALYDAHAKVVRVSALRLGAKTWTVYPTKAVTLANGDVFGARALAAGTVEVYRNGVLLTTVTLNTADKTFFAAKGGKIGIWTIGSSNALLDDFGGGTTS